MNVNRQNDKGGTEVMLVAHIANIDRMAALKTIIDKDPSLEVVCSALELAAKIGNIEVKNISLFCFKYRLVIFKAGC